MSSFDMSQINQSLIGIDHKHTVNAYVLRDKLMNLNPSTQIKNSMNKLGYMNVNFHEESTNFLIHFTMQNLKTSFMNVKKMTNENYMETLKETIEYKNFANTLNKRMKRSIELSNFVDSTNNEGFYNSLTLEELIFIGY
jgi:hypothetical protein